MTTLAYPPISPTESPFGYDAPRSTSCLYNIDSRSIVKLEPMEHSYDTNMSCRSNQNFNNDACTRNLNSIKQSPLFTETANNLLSWTTKHPENWSDSEILDWVFFVADKQRFDGSKVCGEAYQNLSGDKLCSMTRNDFLNVDPFFGSAMYDLFRQLVDTASFSAPTKPETFNYDPVYVPFPSSDDTAFVPGDGSNTDLVDFSVLIGGYKYDFDVEKNLFPETSDQGYVSGESDQEQDWGMQAPNAYDCLSAEEEMEINPLSMIPCNKVFQTPKRRMVTHSVSSEEGDSLGCQDTRPPRPNKARSGGSKGNHLWEFVRDLLKDNTVNPSLLKWEDKSIGVFRFVNSEAVAQMWGRKKNNRQMTYEKLSRAMRFCRSAGYFETIPKNGRFPKKLCFKFGPKAHGWQD
ncbi:ETS-related transcription factor Elf-3 isoform X1 [Patella vulgata]|uniref:ETS-related transcription factor Elf-3 isoform X1 n=3 Tax=Patella vulgata TaxID=6465 RepID=UPI0021800D96|nr:ETS-related transcription factor Elf-3 isoform X1 [Patella vulgata]